MTVPEARPAYGDESLPRVRWAAVAAMLAGLLAGGALLLRPLLNVELGTPESTALALMGALGQLLIAASLLGVHLVYGPTYGLLGRWAVVHGSPDRLGLINLNGWVVAPRPNWGWRAKPNAGGEGRR